MKVANFQLKDYGMRGKDAISRCNAALSQFPGFTLVSSLICFKKQTQMNKTVLMAHRTGPICKYLTFLQPPPKFELLVGSHFGFCFQHVNNEAIFVLQSHIKRCFTLKREGEREKIQLYFLKSVGAKHFIRNQQNHRLFHSEQPATVDGYLSCGQLKIYVQLMFMLIY